jgi:hypothetical protein
MAPIMVPAPALELGWWEATPGRPLWDSNGAAGRPQQQHEFDVSKERAIDRDFQADRRRVRLGMLTPSSGFWYSRAREPIKRNDEPSRDRTGTSGGEPSRISREITTSTNRESEF